MAKHRAIHAPGTKFGKGRPPVHDLTSADFTLHDDTIALVYDCSVDVVKAWRRNRDVPARTQPRRKSPGRPPKFSLVFFDPSRSAQWNADTIGCSYQHAWQLLKNHKS